MTTTELRNRAVSGGHYNVYEAPQGIRRSYAPTTRRFVTPSGTGRPIKYGDRIFVRIVSVERGWRTIADFCLTQVNDMSEIIGELRRYTHGERGLTRLYIRNATRGWSFEQPFKLYSDEERIRRSCVDAANRNMPAVSVSHNAAQPSSRREIPESVRLRYQM